MDGVLGVSRTFDTVGGMARSAEDLAILTEIILNPSARRRLPENGYRVFMNGSWHGIRIGFMDPKLWKLPTTLCTPDAKVSAQMVNLVTSVHFVTLNCH
jgi:amidase